MNSKFWNVKTDGNKSNIDLFGFVGGSKDGGDIFAPEGFNEKEFLNEFRAIPTDNELNISINSFGGAVYTALSIYSLLKTHKGQITFRVDGTAMSAATIITSVPGAKVVMPRGSMMMIHKVSSAVWGNVDDMRKEADVLEQLEQNIINIYAEKTGRSVEEIREKVDAETFFTAEEAVEFGLADELDESKTVENKAVGDKVMCNGLEVKAEFFKRAPKGLLKAEPEQVSAVKKEVQVMNLEQLKAEYPDLVEQIRAEAVNEGAEKERARIQAIEDIAMPGHEDLVVKAKFDGVTTAEALAVQMVKAEKARSAKTALDRFEDAKELEDAHVTEDAGVVADKAAAEQKLQNHLANVCKY